MTVSTLSDRAGMTSSTTGTGTMTLGAAIGTSSPFVCSYQSFATSGITNGLTVSYLILDASSNWEVGRGVYSSSGPTLTRSPLWSSNGGSAISLSGNAQVYITALAEDIMTNWVAGTGLTGGTIMNGQTAAVNPAILQSYLAGVQIQNSSPANTTIGITAGVCVDSTNTVLMTVGNIAKNTSGSWVAGSGNSGMGNGLTVAATTWYHVFAIINNGSADIYFDTSVTAANAPANTTAFRRLGSIKTDGSAHILAFSQNGNEFLWATPFQDIVGNVATTSPALMTLNVPPGLAVWAQVAWTLVFASTGGTASNIYSPVQAFTTLTGATTMFVNAAVIQTNATLITRTNTSSQVEWVSNVGSRANLYGATLGWIDTRGRDN